MNVYGNERTGRSFGIRISQDGALNWRWTVERERDGFFEPVLSGHSLTRAMAKKSALRALNNFHTRKH